MSVSVGPDADLGAIIAGGDAFLTRIQQFQQAKANAEASFVALNLGQSAATALADAQRARQDAIDALAQATDRAAATVVAAQAKAQQIVGEALAEAERLGVEGKTKTQALEAELVKARETLSTWAEGVKAEANSLLDRARGRHSEAEQVLAAASDKQQSVDALHSALSQQLDAAKAAEANFKAKVEAIKSAIS